MHMQGIADDWDAVAGHLTGCLYTLVIVSWHVSREMK